MPCYSGATRLYQPKLKGLAVLADLFAELLRRSEDRWHRLSDLPYLFFFFFLARFFFWRATPFSAERVSLCGGMWLERRPFFSALFRPVLTLPQPPGLRKTPCYLSPQLVSSLLTCSIPRKILSIANPHISSHLRSNQIQSTMCECVSFRPLRRGVGQPRQKKEAKANDDADTALLLLQLSTLSPSLTMRTT
jgi:hypothetical protein